MNGNNLKTTVVKNMIILFILAVKCGILDEKGDYIDCYRTRVNLFMTVHIHVVFYL